MNFSGECLQCIFHEFQTPATYAFDAVELNLPRDTEADAIQTELPPAYTFKSYRTFSIDENCVTNSPQQDGQYIGRDRHEKFLDSDQNLSKASPLEVTLAQGSPPEELRHRY